MERFLTHLAAPLALALFASAWSGAAGGDAGRTAGVATSGTASSTSSDTSGGTAGGTAAQPAWRWDLPSHFPAPPVPPDNPMSEAKFQLGRTLFYDTRLSSNGIQSCASCHAQDKAFSDGLPRSRGATGEFTPRNAQGLANTAWRQSLTWMRPDLDTLEKQAPVPLFGTHPIEMGLTPDNQDAVLASLRADPALLAQFSAAFPEQAEPVTMPAVVKALATFERALVSADSKFDRHLQGKASLDATELRGKALFFSDQAKCFRCHGGFNFDGAASAFQVTILHSVLPAADGAGDIPPLARGLSERTGKASDTGKFRVPSLRNVALTAPYMHDGSVATLARVLDLYAAGGTDAGGGRRNPHRNPILDGIRLSGQDRLDLLAFLNTLSDGGFTSNPRFADPTPEAPVPPA